MLHPIQRMRLMTAEQLHRSSGLLGHGQGTLTKLLITHQQKKHEFI